MNRGHLVIAGTRGVPAAHGGFETFAERLGLYLVSRGWKVSVPCQGGAHDIPGESEWRGIRRIVIPVAQKGAAGTVLFDWKSTAFAVKSADVVLVLGYNTAIFSLWYRLKHIPCLINMDGIEWKRAKWKWWQRIWLYLNERIAGLVGARLIADHPGIREHLRRGILARKEISVIPYGADLIHKAPAEPLNRLGLDPRGYVLVIARPEPENHILEIVRAFSSRRRGMKFVVLGAFMPETSPYHRAVLEAASDEVIFPGAIYDAAFVGALRANAALYLHGHSVGGTNPSLVEALGAGSAVLAHDNVYNRWVAGSGAAYFRSEEECASALGDLLGDESRLSRMRAASRARFAERFRWDDVLRCYEELLSAAIGGKALDGEIRRQAAQGVRAHCDEEATGGAAAVGVFDSLAPHHADRMQLDRRNHPPS